MSTIKKRLRYNYNTNSWDENCIEFTIVNVSHQSIPSLKSLSHCPFVQDMTRAYLQSHGMYIDEDH